MKIEHEYVDKPRTLTNRWGPIERELSMTTYSWSCFICKKDRSVSLKPGENRIVAYHVRGVPRYPEGVTCCIGCFTYIRRGDFYGD
jgi:hypothetical protein